MRIPLLMFGLVCVLGISGAHAQSTRDVNTKPTAPAPKYQAQKKQKKGFFLFNIFKKKPQSDIAAFRARMEETSRKRLKEMKKAKDPQYSDPTYFGHKKPPKKRPPGKMKFCKECGMRH